MGCEDAARPESGDDFVEDEANAVAVADPADAARETRGAAR